MLVNDIPDHLDGYLHALVARGMVVKVAESGGDALTMAAHLHPHCIVVDERVSDMRGWELCKAIKAVPELSVIPILMLAQELTIEAATRGQNVGCEAWLARPNTPDDLASAVQHLVAAGVSAPRSASEALWGGTSCAACGSARVRSALRIGPAQYLTCADCRFHWRIDAAGEAAV